MLLQLSNKSQQFIMGAVGNRGTREQYGVRVGHLFNGERIDLSTNSLS